MKSHIQKIAGVGLIFLSIALVMAASSCTEKPMTQAKASSELLSQVVLRQQQLASPTTERLDQMRAKGMRTENLEVQRIYIYLAQKLTTPQTDELKTLGITPYPDSWIPPVGNHPTGFILADIPIDKLDALAAKPYVVRLDTAEVQSHPQQNISPGSV